MRVSEREGACAKMRAACVCRCFLLEKAKSFGFLLNQDQKSRPVVEIFDRFEYVSKSLATRYLCTQKKFPEYFNTNNSTTRISAALSKRKFSFDPQRLPQKPQVQDSRKMPRYETVEKGTPNSKQYRVFFSKFHKKL